MFLSEPPLELRAEITTVKAASFPASWGLDVTALETVCSGEQELAGTGPPGYHPVPLQPWPPAAPKDLSCRYHLTALEKTSSSLQFSRGVGGGGSSGHPSPSKPGVLSFHCHPRLTSTPAPWFRGPGCGNSGRRAGLYSLRPSLGSSRSSDPRPL